MLARVNAFTSAVTRLRRVYSLSHDLAGPAMLHTDAVAGPAVHTDHWLDTRPLVLGYLRLRPTGAADVSARLQVELQQFAEREGLALADTYIERFDAMAYGRHSSAFSALVDAVRNPEVYGILVPSLRHLSRFPGTAKAIRATIETETGARVLAMCSDA